MGVQMCLYLKNYHDIRMESVIMTVISKEMHTLVTLRK